MDQESITKGILAGIVDHYIRDISQDPQRGIRKLVDMAERTSDGPTQRICYQMMQEMAANQSSPYYDMIHHLVTSIDPKTIKKFGINLGHNAWTFGSGNIRRCISQNGTLLSWAVIIDRREAPQMIPFSEISELVNRGLKTNVYAWLLMTSGPLREWDDFVKLFREQDESVFALRVTADALTEEIMDEVTEIPNLMILLDTDTPDWQATAEELSSKGILYSVCRVVSTEAQAEEIRSGSWLEELIPYHPLIAFTIADDNAPEQTIRGIKEYMWNTRLAQLHPILPSDLISDFVVINRLVAHKDILYRVNPDGSADAAEKEQFRKTELTGKDLF